MNKRWLFLCLLMVGGAVFAQTQGAQQTNPIISLNLGNNAGEAATNAVQIFLLLTVLSLVPSLMVLMTSFTRIVIVFSFLRQAMGTQNVPSNNILAGMAVIMTIFVMSAPIREIKTTAYDPMAAGEITLSEALDRSVDPLKVFMLKHTREKDLALFVKLSNSPKPATRMDVPLEVLTPAFIISELKTAFEIGFLVFIPFLIVDLVVASILLAMGMMMLPPVMISMPFKILLFIMVDGWNLLVGSLMLSFT